MICFHCRRTRNDNESKFHQHHISYYPEFMALLCPECHNAITLLNTVIRRKKQAALEATERISLWRLFLSKQLFEVTILNEGRNYLIIHPLCSHHLAEPKTIVLQHSNKVEVFRFNTELENHEQKKLWTRG